MARTLRNLASYGVLGARAAEFLDMRRAKHFSPGTIEWNESNLRAFFNWCEERSLRNPTEITRPILERYQRWLFYYRCIALSKGVFRVREPRPPRVATPSACAWTARQGGAGRV